MKIGLDFDGVITNLGKLKSLVAEKLLDKKIPESYFDREFALVNKFLTHEEHELVKQFAYFEEEALPLTEPVSGALEYIGKLLADGHTIKVVTARDGKALEHAKKWLQKYELSIPIEGVGFENDKREGVLGLDAFVDDYLIQLYEMRDIVPHRFLFSWGYNAKYNEKEYATRVSSWQELYEKLKALS